MSENKKWWRIILDFILLLLGYKSISQTIEINSDSNQEVDNEVQSVNSQSEQINNNSTGVNSSEDGGINFDEFNKKMEK